MDEYLWIERGISLLVDIPYPITPHSSLNPNQSARVQDIIQED